MVCRYDDIWPRQAHINHGRQHGEIMFAAQVHPEIEDGFITEIAQPQLAADGRQMDLHFQPRETFADAISRPHRERQQRQRRAFCLVEPIRIELVRMGPDIRPPLHDVGRYIDFRAGRNEEIAELVVAAGAARQ